MPVIAFASSKGGSGKSTSCVVMGCELARQGLAKGIRVAIVDADPNQPIADWSKLEGMPENIDVYEKVNEENILDIIDKAKQSAAFVLVDLEGLASNAVTYAVSQADLVIVPCQQSQNDAKQAVRTAKTIKNSSRMLGRDIPFCILMTRVSAAFRTKTGKYLEGVFDSAGFEVLGVSLIEREAFRNIFSFGGCVNELEFKNSKEKTAINNAAKNAHLLVEEIKRKLKSSISNREQGDH